MTHWAGELEQAQYERWLELVKEASAQARSCGFAIAVLRSRAGADESPAWTKVNLRSFASMDAGVVAFLPVTMAAMAALTGIAARRRSRR